MITVLTPAYNRASLIKKAYKSLLKQTNKDFEWLVIDDGSKDNTNDIIDGFIKENKIKIRYFYKENGGKHTALNIGFKKAKGEYLIILDSDDFLENNAIEKITEYWNKYKNNKKIASICFLRGTPDRKQIGKNYEGTEIISNNIEFRYNKKHLGDMAETFKTSILKKFEFIVFEGERFLSEAIVWNQIAFDYDTVYINEIIYIGDYLEGGLSNNILKIRYKSPLGCIENAKIFLDKRFKTSIRLKNAIIYDGFSLIANKNIKEITTGTKYKILTTFFLPAGYLFKIYMEKKGGKNEKK